MFKSVFVTQIEPHRRPRHSWFIVRAWRLFRALVTDRAYRHVMWLYWTRPKAVFQPFNDTRPDRYPVIFRGVQAAL